MYNIIFWTYGTVPVRRFQFWFSGKNRFSMDFGRELLKKLIIMISCFAFREISFEFRDNFAHFSISCFTLLKENFAKREIDNFAKFSRKYENENFRSHPILKTLWQASGISKSVALTMKSSKKEVTLLFPMELVLDNIW